LKCFALPGSQLVKVIKAGFFRFFIFEKSYTFNFFEESEQSKLSKLIRLWEDKSIFSPSSLKKMRNPHESWENYKEQLRVSYEKAIERNTKTFIDTYNNFEKQHDAFVAHAKSTINTLVNSYQELIQCLNNNKSFSFITGNSI